MHTTTSTTASLVLVLRREEGAIERMLGVIRRRGFSALALAVVPDGADAWSALLSVSGERDFDMLLRQLEKLEDVRVALRVPPDVRRE